MNESTPTLLALEVMSPRPPVEVWEASRRVEAETREAFERFQATNPVLPGLTREMRRWMEFETRLRPTIPGARVVEDYLAAFWFELPAVFDRYYDRTHPMVTGDRKLWRAIKNLPSQMTLLDAAARFGWNEPYFCFVLKEAAYGFRYLTEYLDVVDPKAKSRRRVHRRFR